MFWTLHSFDKWLSWNDLVYIINSSVKGRLNNTLGVDKVSHEHFCFFKSDLKAFVNVMLERFGFKKQILCSSCHILKSNKKTVIFKSNMSHGGIRKVTYYLNGPLLLLLKWFAKKHVSMPSNITTGKTLL